MKTNPKLNRSNGGLRRGPVNRTKINNQTRSASGVSTGNVKNRIGKPGTAKPVIDLRQKLARNAKPTAKVTTTTKPATSSDVKSRLGLQSRTARLEALKDARAQLKSIKDKTKNFKDVTQAASTLKKTVPQLNAIKNRQDQRGQQMTRKQPVSTTSIKEQAKQDRDRLLKDRPIGMRRIDRGGFKSDLRTRGERTIKSTVQPIIIQPQYIPTSQPIIYQQPSHHHSSYDSVPNRYVSRSEINSPPEVISPNVGNSVLVSNLSPKITEDEVAELFGDIGALMNVQIINSTTALVTYFAAQHASKAVKVYNYRLLDGIAMNCTQLNYPKMTSHESSLHSGRMYSDSIQTAPRTSLRPSNYHLGL